MLEIARSEIIMSDEMLGKRIASLRKERKLTQVELAAEINKSRGYLAGIESGNDTPGRDTINKLAAYFGVSSAWLEGDDTYTPRERSFVSLIRGLPQDEVAALEEYLKARTQAAKKKQ